MENAMVWISVLGVIVIPFVGWLVNTLITKKLEFIESKQKEDRELFFRKLDEDRADAEKSYVRRDIYDQAMAFHDEKIESTLKSLLEVVNTKFQNVEIKIDGLRTLINEKLNVKGGIK